MNTFKKIICFIKGHKWTCAAMKGIPPKKVETWEDVKEYAKMYCDRCGYESKLNSRI